MTVLVFGRTGQVATELAALVPDITCLDRTQADLADPEACAQAIRAHRPAAVINAAAYTAVDDAEKDEALATTINAKAPARMAEVCRALDLPFVHLSTDYVFDGSGTDPRTPDDPTGPLGAYGRSKHAGEAAIQAAGGAYAILRTSWVFSAHGKNFLQSMLDLSLTRDRLSIVADQIGGPTPARDIAQACYRIATILRDHPDCTGIYHFAGAPYVSWADFAREIFKAAGRDITVTPIPTQDYPTPASRPLNSRLDCATTHQAFGLAQPDWRRAVADITQTLAKKQCPPHPIGEHDDRHENQAARSCGSRAETVRGSPGLVCRKLEPTALARRRN